LHLHASQRNDWFCLSYRDDSLVYAAAYRYRCRGGLQSVRGSWRSSACPESDSIQKASYSMCNLLDPVHSPTLQASRSYHYGAKRRVVQPMLWRTTFAKIVAYEPIVAETLGYVLLQGKVCNKQSEEDNANGKLGTKGKRSGTCIRRDRGESSSRNVPPFRRHAVNWRIEKTVLKQHVIGVDSKLIRTGQRT
jgi:hypothetical protein